jgi:hypothetical protein
MLAELRVAAELAPPLDPAMRADGGAPAIPVKPLEPAVLADGGAAPQPDPAVFANCATAAHEY